MWPKLGNCKGAEFIQCRFWSIISFGNTFFFWFNLLLTCEKSKTYLWTHIWQFCHQYDLFFFQKDYIKFCFVLCSHQMSWTKFCYLLAYLFIWKRAKSKINWSFVYQNWFHIFVIFQFLYLKKSKNVCFDLVR